MDDICDSGKTTDEAKKMTKDLDQVLETGGFNVKGWVSNENLYDNDDNDGCNEMKILEGECADKILGVAWNNETDSLTFKIKADIPKSTPGQNGRLTERIILSCIARIYDPIGIAAPVVIKAKIGMQRLWQRGYGWDAQLPADVCSQWARIFGQFQKLNDVAFHRSLTPRNASGYPTLCIFSDASREAFETCGYVRWEIGEKSYKIRFVAAKSRVAPLKELSFPKLELQAAVLAVRLYQSIGSESGIPFKRVVFFTDSQIVYIWIRSQSRVFKPRVRATP